MKHRCSRCRRTLPAKDFSADASRKTGVFPWCKACVVEQRIVDKPKVYEGTGGERLCLECGRDITGSHPNRKYCSVLCKERATSRRGQTGLTPDEYRCLMEAQGNRCGLCGRPITKGRRMAIDHDHRTGKVRGVICAVRCNYQLLGQFHEDIELFKNAVRYLESPPANAVWEEPKWWPGSLGAAGMIDAGAP